MKVNGYQIREALRRWDLLRKTALQQFPDSLYFFEGEQKSSPVEIAQSFRDADIAYCKIKDLQQYYNQQVVFSVQGQKINLSLAVKLVGGAGQLEKMWRSAAIEKKDRYNYHDYKSRGKDNEYANRSISNSEAIKQFDQTSRFANALRSAIARANNTDVEIQENIFPITPAELEKLIT